MICHSVLRLAGSWWSALPCRLYCLAVLLPNSSFLELTLGKLKVIWRHCTWGYLGRQSKEGVIIFSAGPPAQWPSTFLFHPSLLAAPLGQHNYTRFLAGFPDSGQVWRLAFRFLAARSHMAWALQFEPIISRNNDVNWNNGQLMINWWALSYPFTKCFRSYSLLLRRSHLPLLWMPSVYSSTPAISHVFVDLIHLKAEWAMTIYRRKAWWLRTGAGHSCVQWTVILLFLTCELHYEKLTHIYRSWSLNVYML